MVVKSISARRYSDDTLITGPGSLSFSTMTVSQALRSLSAVMSSRTLDTLTSPRITVTDVRNSSSDSTTKSAVSLVGMTEARAVGEKIVNED